MTRTIAQNLKLYTSNVSRPELVAVLAPDVIGSLEHTTRLHGGFHELSLTIAATEGEFRQWRQERLLGRLSLAEPAGRITWEGRVEAVALLERLGRGRKWQVSLTARGYWSNLTDSVRNRSYVTGKDTGGSIIVGLLGDVHAQTRQLSLSTEHVATGPAIVQEYQDDWTIWRILTDRRRGVASFGSGSGAKMNVAVWEGRKLHYGARRLARGRKSGVRLWHSYMRAENGGGVVLPASNAGRAMPLRVDWSDVANAVAVTYEKSGKVVRTPQAIDARSIATHVRRERNVPNIGESTSTSALQRRDTELGLRSRLSVRPTSDALAVNRVWDADGIEWPLCRVRAGDVIRVPDFTPSTADLDRVVSDAYRTFFIEETHCDHAAGVLTIRPDGEKG